MTIALREDYDAPRLQGLARLSRDAGQVRRLLALAAIYAGGSRTDAAQVGGVTLQIVRDWVVKFNAHGPDGLIERRAPGAEPLLSDAHRAALAGVVESGPIASVHGVVRWRLIDLCQWVRDTFGISIAKATMSRELRAMNFRKLSARPRHHEQAEDAVALFKTALPTSWRRSRASAALRPGA